MKESNAKKRNSGITLISLVVTIVVILILAGITISLTLGDNGIVTKAQDSVEKQKTVTAKEEVEMAWVGIVADRISGSLTDSQIQTKLQSALPNGTVTYYANKIIYEKGDTTYKYSVNSEGKITGYLDELNGIKVGDYVTYEAPTRTAYNLTSDISGYEDDQTISREYTTWRVLNINDDGSMDLVANVTSSNKYVFFGGATRI